MKVRPLGSRVLVKPREEEERTPGGSILPDTAKEKPQEGVVVAVGPGKLLERSAFRPMSSCACSNASRRKRDWVVEAATPQGC